MSSLLGSDALDDWWARAVDGESRPGPARSRQAAWRLAAAEVEDGFGALGRLAARRGFVLARAELRAAGVEDRTVRRLVRRGLWQCPRRGFVCVLPVRGGGRPGGGDEELVIAAAARSRPGTLVSQDSAAVLQGLPRLRRHTRTRLTTTAPSAGGGWPDLLINVVGLCDRERSSWFGVPMTSPARTVIDVARRSGVAAGLVTADGVLREQLATETELELSLRSARGRPGVLAAERVVELARGGSESVLETLTRLCLVDGGFTERLVLQALVETDRRTYRVDLLVADRRVIIEADGALKYRDDLQALWNEKVRQDALERAGYLIVRVTWDEVTSHPERVLARVRAACARSARSVF